MIVGSWPLQPEHPETAAIFAAVRREIEEYRALVTAGVCEYTEADNREPKVKRVSSDVRRHG